jgi:glycogen debranching enzyme
MESDKKPKKPIMATKIATRPAAIAGKLADAKDVAVKKATKPILLYTPNKWTSPNLALRTVTSKSGLGVYASSDTLFRGAVFGRDSLEVAEDLMYLKPKLVERILLTLASLQGESTNHANEEEPGKIVHEYRTTVVDGKPLDSISQEIFNRLYVLWGGHDNVLAYYGSVDATPQYVRVLAQYCRLYGHNILLKQVTLRNGYIVSVLDVLENALDWLTRHLKSSKSGLVEYLRQNPHGIENQAWKDSVEFYVHENGEFANHSQPIASIEIQGLAYDALMDAANLLPSRAKEWRRIAEKLRKKTLEELWGEQTQYFALGLDFSEHGQQRVIRTKAANAAALLDSSFFDHIDPSEKKKYVSAIVRTIMGDDFLTDAGIRSRALSESRLVPFWDYHGSYTSWPKETYDIAKGLRRQGFPKLAVELENRLLNVVKAMRSYPEFLYVDKRGRVLGVSQSSHGHGELIFVESTNHPERIQAWTVSAIVAITSKNSIFRRPKKSKQQPWQEELEKDILRTIPHMRIMKSVKELTARYPAYPYKLKGK